MQELWQLSVKFKSFDKIPSLKACTKCTHTFQQMIAFPFSMNRHGYICVSYRNRPVPKEFTYIFVRIFVSWTLDLNNWLLMQPVYREITVDMIMDANHRLSSAKILIDSSCGC